METYNYGPFFFFFGVLSRVRLFVTPWTVVCPGSSVHEISQARVLEWVAISFSREMAVVVTGKESESESHSVFLTVCNPMDYT